MRLEEPDKEMDCIHVAGSNGKGRHVHNSLLVLSGQVTQSVCFLRLI